MSLRLRLLRFGVPLLPYALWIILMPITGQYDLFLNAWQTHHVNKGYWNLYAHLSQVHNFAVPGHPPAPYPFGFYLFYAGWLEVLQRVGLIDYNAWSTPLIVREFPAAVLALKLPYFAAHLAIGVLLFKAAPPGWRWAAWAIWAWSLSPAYLLFMGQNDLPMALLMIAATALGAHAIQQQQSGDPRWRLAALASAALLGVGATYKTAPLMLVPPFALLLATRWRERAALVALPVTIFALSALPFLDTPAFVNGALLNPEGTRLFAGVQIFAQPVSLFLVTYVGLLILLATRSPERRQPVDVWLAGAGVFSALFLFAWTQFYWPVWLTVFLVGLIAQDARRRALWLSVWLVSEIVFGALLPSLHRDFGIGLLKLGSEQFQFLLLEVAIELLTPALKQPFDALWNILRSAQVGAYLVTMSVVFVALGFTLSTPSFARAHRAPLVVALGVPFLALSSTVIAALALSYNTVAHEFDRRVVGEVRLSAEQPSFTQVFSPALPSSNGVLLWSTSPPMATLEACAHTDAGTFCAPSRPVQNFYFNFNGQAFWFGMTSGKTIEALSFRLNAPAENSFVAKVGRQRPRFGEQHYVIQGDTRIEGIMRMTLLNTFDPLRAGADITSRLTLDWRTWLLLGIAAVAVFSISWRAAFGRRRLLQKKGNETA